MIRKDCISSAAKQSGRPCAGKDRGFLISSPFQVSAPRLITEKAAIHTDLPPTLLVGLRVEAAMSKRHPSLDRFRVLLITCLDRDEIWHEHFPFSGFSAKRILELEDKHGVGHYDDRRILLTNARRQIDQLDLDRIYGILKTAKHEHQRSASRRYATDDLRDLVEQRDLIVRNLTKWLPRLSGFLLQRTITQDGARPPRIIQAIDRLQEAIAEDLLLQYPVTGRLRSARPGRPAKDHVKSARRALGLAHVPAEVRDELLVAIGLKPYRP